MNGRFCPGGLRVAQAGIFQKSIIPRQRNSGNIIVDIIYAPDRNQRLLKRQAAVPRAVWERWTYAKPGKYMPGNIRVP